MQEDKTVFANQISSGTLFSFKHLKASVCSVVLFSHRINQVLARDLNKFQFIFASAFKKL